MDDYSQKRMFLVISAWSGMSQIAKREKKEQDKIG